MRTSSPFVLLRAFRGASFLFLLLFTLRATAQDYVYQRSLGLESMGLYRFFQPTGIAIDGNGNSYVVDSYLNRVLKLNANQELVLQFGTLGTANGQFNKPVAIAIDEQGNLYVVDEGNKRVQKFTSNGAFLGKFGTDGTGNGQFKKPAGIAISGQGKIYVTDYTTHRVQAFTTNGAFITAFGSQGSGNGQFLSPSGIAADLQGNVFVVDNTHRLQKFNATGVFVAATGGLGSGNGQLNEPRGLAVDGQGNVYVADMSNNRIQKFTNQGAFVSKFGALGTNDGQLDAPQGIAVDAAGNLYVVERDNARGQKFTSEGSFLAKFGQRPNISGQFVNPGSVAVTPTGTTVVGANTTVQKFNANGNYLLQFGVSSVGNMSVDAAGNVYTADHYENRIGKFSPNGTLLAYLGEYGSNPGKLYTPLGVAVDANGNMYIADTGNNRVQRFSPNGTLLNAFGSTGSGNGQFIEPYDVAVDGQGNVYVADKLNHRIQKFSATGVYLAKFGTYGTGLGQFKHPTSVAVDAAGNVYVADSKNHRIQKFTANGSFFASFGSIGIGNNQLQEPIGLDVDAAGNVYVADMLNHRVQIWKPGISIAPISKKIANEGLTLQVQVPVANPHGYGLMYELQGASYGATLNASTGLFSFTPTEIQGGNTYTFNVKVTTNTSPALTDVRSFQVEVNEGNRMPVLAPIPAQNGTVGYPVNFTAAATDDDIPAQILTYSLVNAPSNASINASTGAFTWTPAFPQTGTHQFIVRVNDGFASVQTSVTVTVVNSSAFRINAGDKNYLTTDGRGFASDFYFTNGVSAISTGDITNSTDDPIYQSMRFHTANFSYNVPTGNGTFTVTLHFAETYFGVKTSGGPGLRRFHVDMEGSRKLTNYDIFTSAGGAMKAKTETFQVTVTDNLLNIVFVKTVFNNPCVAAIEIIPVANGARQAAAVGESPESATGSWAKKLYPNPVVDRLTVDLSIPAQQITATALIDLTGYPVAQNTHRVSDDYQLELDHVAALRSGVYLLRLYTAQGYQVVKFIKQ